MPRSRTPSRLTAVRVALWFALVLAAAGVGLIVGATLGLLIGTGAGLLVAGLASAAVLWFVVDAEPGAMRR